MTDTKPDDQLPESPTPEYIETSTISFRTDAGRLQLKHSGSEDWQDVSSARLFPLTEPEKWISIADKDAKEIGVLLDLKGLSHESTQALREDLRRRYLVPQILRVLSTRTRFDLVEWTVDTDRGQITFLTRQTHETAQRLADGRIIFTDVQSNRYDVPDVGDMDVDSRRLIEERL